MDLATLLEAASSEGAGILLLARASVPRLLSPAGTRDLRLPSLSASDFDSIVEIVLDPSRRDRLATEGRVRAAFSSPTHGRFRIDVAGSHGDQRIEIRAVPTLLPTPAELGVDNAGRGLDRLSENRPGIVVLGGPPRSGRSLLEAVIVRRLASSLPGGRITTVEECVEYVHVGGTCTVTQLEVGTNVPSVTAAVLAARASPPDVMCVGPLETPGVLNAALRLVDAGTLVIGTTEAATIAATRRTLSFGDTVPRARVARAISGIHCQVLVRSTEGWRWVPAVERVFASPHIRELYERAADSTLYAAMQADGAKVGPLTRNQSLASLCAQRRIRPEDALAASENGAELAEMIARGEDPFGRQRPGRLVR